MSNEKNCLIDITKNGNKIFQNLESHFTKLRFSKQTFDKTNKIQSFTE